LGTIFLQQVHKGHEKLVDVLLHEWVDGLSTMEFDAFNELAWMDGALETVS
jgi:hypothetical protein